MNLTKQSLDKKPNNKRLTDSNSAKSSAAALEILVLLLEPAALFPALGACPCSNNVLRNDTSSSLFKIPAPNICKHFRNSAWGVWRRDPAGLSGDISLKFKWVFALEKKVSSLAFGGIGGSGMNLGRPFLAAICATVSSPLTNENYEGA